MINQKILLLFILIGGVWGTSACSKKSQASSSSEVYEANLGQDRPHYTYVEPVIEIEKPKEPEKKPPTRYRPSREEEPLYVNKRLEAVLDTMAAQNRSVRYISGFRVQIYVGNLRQEADAAKAYIYQLFPELSPYVSYSQPTYRVKAGDFMYRSDAEDYLNQIREQYPAAIILSDRVEIKKGLQIRASNDAPKY
jgi:hypothetical protein